MAKEVMSLRLRASAYETLLIGRALRILLMPVQLVPISGLGMEVVSSWITAAKVRTNPSFAGTDTLGW